jgi:hypothetical protein
MKPTRKTAIQYANDIDGLTVQLGQALIALSALEAEVVGEMRQSTLLEIIETQLWNINAVNEQPAF